jgi:hypothetical protein
MSWSAQRPGCNRDRWPDTSREPRDCNSDCRRAVGSRSSASWHDGEQQAAQEGANLLAAGSFGGTKNGGDEAALAIEYDDRLKAVFVIMRIEQPQLLAAMNRVERVVDVQRDPFGNPLEGLAPF